MEKPFMVSNHSDNKSERDNMSNKIRRLSGKIKQYHLTFSRQGRRTYENDTRIRLEVDFATTEDPPRYVDVVFNETGWAILGEFHQRDDSPPFIWVFLPNHEFAKYYAMLRHEESVYFSCAFEENSDGSVGRMLGFSLETFDRGTTS